MNSEKTVLDIAKEAKRASYEMSQTSCEHRNAALMAMAAALRQNAEVLISANALDVSAAREKDVPESLIDRLMLNEDRIEGMASALEELVALPDPVGRVIEQRTMYNGIELSRVTVPLGVVAMVYEARPNVTADAAGICLKSGNAVVLRGGSMAFHSNQSIASVLAEAAEGEGMPAGCVSIIETIDRSATDELMGLRGIVDVLIPRGGAGLIAHCVEHSKVPVIETGTGNCHTYVHASADFEKAEAIIMNAKTQRTGVCNACESVLVDRSVAADVLPRILVSLRDANVLMHVDEQVVGICEQTGLREGVEYVAGTEEDWGREYLGLEISIKTVENVSEAIAHINTYGTGHSESIVAQDQEAIEAFLSGVDAAAVYVNASTRFTDGGEFGLGAEIGISTQKLHVRGPFALEALTSSKYLLRGNGQTR